MLVALAGGLFLFYKWPPTSSTPTAHAPTAHAPTAAATKSQEPSKGSSSHTLLGRQADAKGNARKIVMTDSLRNGSLYKRYRKEVQGPHYRHPLGKYDRLGCEKTTDQMIIELARERDEDPSSYLVLNDEMRNSSLCKMYKESVKAPGYKHLKGKHDKLGCEKTIDQMTVELMRARAARFF